MTLWC